MLEIKQELFVRICRCLLTVSARLDFPFSSLVVRMCEELARLVASMKLFTHRSQSSQDIHVNVRNDNDNDH